MGMHKVSNSDKTVTVRQNYVICHLVYVNLTEHIACMQLKTKTMADFIFPLKLGSFKLGFRPQSGLKPT